MANKVLIYTGAPESSTLDWTTTELLTDFHQQITQFTGQFDQFDRARAVPSTHVNVGAEASSAPSHAFWRSVPLEKQHVSTGFSQFAHDFGFELGPGAPSISTTSISFGTSFQEDSDDESQPRRGQRHGPRHGPRPSDITSQFYEHSLAIHEDVTSSQLILSQPDSRQDGTSFQTDDSAASTSFQTTSNSFSHLPSVKEPLLFPNSDINNLEDLPTAAYITNIHPQTMTRNLIVGIISISRPHEVKTRWGSTKTLIEVLVGDDTKAGFAVTFWLASKNPVAGTILSGLRPGDVVLIQNVALNAFMKKVYGYSLHKDLTQIHLLYRARLGADDIGGYYSTSDLMVGGAAHPQLAKIRRVWDWVINFVGDGRPGRAGRETSAADSIRACPWERPPLDSQ